MLKVPFILFLDSKDCSLANQACCGDGCMPISAECCSKSDDDDDHDDDDDDDDDNHHYCSQGSRCGIFKGEVKCCGDRTCSEGSPAAATLITKVSSYTATTITTRPPTITASTPALVQSVTSNYSIT